MLLLEMVNGKAFSLIFNPKVSIVHYSFVGKNTTINRILSVLSEEMIFSPIKHFWKNDLISRLLSICRSEHFRRHDPYPSTIVHM